MGQGDCSAFETFEFGYLRNKKRGRGGYLKALRISRVFLGGVGR
jgi:hypothetical protein